MFPVFNGILKIEWDYQKDFCQCLCSHLESKLAPLFLGSFLRSGSESDSGFFKIIASVMEFWG